MSSSPHPFTLRQLQYAVAVADCLSFRRAAAQCHVSQPALSAALSQAEDGLGVRLFERDRKRVLLTSAGEALVARARRVLQEADDLVGCAESAADPASGTLRVGVIPTLAPYLLPAVAPRLRARFPRLQFAWREEKTADLVVALEAGLLDTILVAREAELGDVESEVIASDAFLLATRRGDPLGLGKKAVDAAELRTANILLLDDGHCFRDQVLEVCSSARAHEGEFRATSLTTLVQMVAGGAGVTLLPAIAVATEARRAGLTTRTVASAKARRTIALVWRKSSPRARMLRELAEALRAALPRIEGVSALSGARG